VLAERAASGPLALELGTPVPAVLAERGLGEDEHAEPEQGGGQVLVVEGGVDGGRGEEDCADGGGVLVAAVGTHGLLRVVRRTGVARSVVVDALAQAGMWDGRRGAPGGRVLCQAWLRWCQARAHLHQRAGGNGWEAWPQIPAVIAAMIAVTATTSITAAPRPAAP
jgi:hypothetical protein